MTVSILMNRGKWWLTMRWLTRPWFARVIDRFDEGTVYRFWVAWLLVKVMVKA